MATKSKIELLLELSDKMFNNGLTRAQDRVEKATKGMQRAFDNFKLNSLRAFNQIQDEIPILGRAMDLITNPIVLASAALLAIGGIMAKGVASAEKFDSAFLPIRQLNLDKSTETMDKYRNSIRDASYEIGINLEKGTNAMYDLQSATGVFGEDAIDIYKKVGRYSIATGADINEAMNATTKSMKAFGIGVEGIDKLLESNAKTVQVGITTFDELARVQTEYAGATSAAGQSVDIGNKIFAMFTSISKSSDIAANQTKTFFQGLGQQAEKINETLKINVFDKDGNMKEADKLLMEISNKFKNMNNQEITDAINKIGGPEGLRGALAKVATGAEDMINTFKAFDSSTFSLDDALKNAEGDFGKLKEMFFNRLDIIFSKIGEKIIPPLMRMMQVLEPIFKVIFDNIDWILPVFTTFIGLLALGTAGMWAFNAAVAMNPIGILILKLAALGALITFIIKKWDDWGAALTIFMGPIGLLIGAFKSLYDHWDSIVQAFKTDGILGGIKRIGLVLLDALLKPVQQLLEMLAKIPGLGYLAERGAGKIQEIRDKLNLVTPGEKESREKKTETKTLYETKEEEKEKPLGNILGDQVTTATGQANQVRTTNISIESFIKGNVGMTNNTSDNVTMEDLERMLQDLFLRMVINAERT